MEDKTYYLSNCFYKTIRYGLKDPFNVYIKWITKIYEGEYLPSIHFYWYDKKRSKFFHFKSYNKNLPYWRKFLFKGQVVSRNSPIS